MAPRDGAEDRAQGLPWRRSTGSLPSFQVRILLVHSAAHSDRVSPREVVHARDVAQYFLHPLSLPVPFVLEKDLGPCFLVFIYIYMGGGSCIILALYKRYHMLCNFV